ncbi:HprK-related kinase A [Pseudoduganella namucuonensis]|uniref:Hpr(Ser) kinase/phosphatase n=1 Tax=Pseudoduganella namucuonensis TaxID=1035707 RepID=A0A1I7GGG0_9BURK|nr:HprK-related kinase A [Pseudoduganella namucuonensis]SFU47401.1 Hpr(Ser) kinase/phosphatase [Pseudoduganella namucuonensis]
MLTIETLTRAELGAGMAADGIVLQTGVFAVQLQSAIPSVVNGIHQLYGNYPLLPSHAFADFHLRLVQSGGLRRWLRPQVDLLYDGVTVFKPLPLAQAFPMFEWGLNWCVANRAHSYLIVHAAVLERDGRAVILPAPPGSGKSTLCAALAHRGWRLLSDELTLIRLADGLVQPLPRPVSLKNASIDIMRAYLGKAELSPPVAGTGKGTVAHLLAPPASVARGAECARPGWVVFPRYQAGASSTLEALTKGQAFMQVASNSFNYSVLGARGFDALAGVIGAADCYRYTYSMLDEAVAAFDQLAARS